MPSPTDSPDSSAPLVTVVDGLGFAEAPRWHDGRLWFSDFFRERVFSCGDDGALREEAVVPQRPSGLGWRADGTLLVVSMEDRRLLARGGDGRLHTVADLAPHSGGPCNDLLVDGAGRAYVGNFGFDLYARAEPRATALLRVDPDGRVHRVAEDLWFPNGMALTPDGRCLIVAETFAHRLTAFDVDADGGLSGRRVWADLPGAYPDGLCLDADGAVWVADARGRRVLQVDAARGVVRTLSTGEQHAYACMLGGADRRTLYVCTAPGIGAAQAATRQARVARVAVAVPGAGRP